MGKKQALRHQRKLEKIAQEQKQQSQLLIRKKIKDFTILGLCGLAMFGMTYASIKGKRYFKEQQAIESLQQARENPDLRQKYLESLVSSNEIPFCTGIVYDETGEKIVSYYRDLSQKLGINSNEFQECIRKVRKELAKGWYFKTPEIFDFNGSNISSKIFVSPKGLNSNNSPSDLKHIIKFHEGRHAEQFARGLKQLGYIDKDTIKKGLETKEIKFEVLYGICELDALNFELQAIEDGKSKVSEQYKQNTLRDYRKARSILEYGAELTNPLQRELIRSVLKVNPQR